MERCSFFMQRKCVWFNDDVLGHWLKEIYAVFSIKAEQSTVQILPSMPLTEVKVPICRREEV